MEQNKAKLLYAFAQAQVSIWDMSYFMYIEAEIRNFYLKFSSFKAFKLWLRNQIKLSIFIDTKEIKCVIEQILIKSDRRTGELG